MDDMDFEQEERLENSIEGVDDSASEPKEAIRMNKNQMQQITLLITILLQVHQITLLYHQKEIDFSRYQVMVIG